MSLKHAAPSALFARTCFPLSPPPPRLHFITLYIHHFALHIIIRSASSAGRIARPLSVTLQSTRHTPTSLDGRSDSNILSMWHHVTTLTLTGCGSTPYVSSDDAFLRKSISTSAGAWPLSIDMYTCRVDVQLTVHVHKRTLHVWRTYTHAYSLSVKSRQE